MRLHLSLRSCAAFLSFTKTASRSFRLISLRSLRSFRRLLRLSRKSFLKPALVVVVMVVVVVVVVNPILVVVGVVAMVVAVLRTDCAQRSFDSLKPLHAPQLKVEGFLGFRRTQHFSLLPCTSQLGTQRHHLCL
jgi:hypothetical protein